jgi:hypothetical protein
MTISMSVSEDSVLSPKLPGALAGTCNSTTSAKRPGFIQDNFGKVSIGKVFTSWPAVIVIAAVGSILIGMCF